VTKISVKTIGLILGPLLCYLILQLSYLGSLSPQAWNVLGVAAWILMFNNSTSILAK